jgi:hypothetical protein
VWGGFGFSPWDWADEKATCELTVNGQPVAFTKGKDGAISFSYTCDAETTFRLRNFANL